MTNKNKTKTMGLGRESSHHLGDTTEDMAMPTNFLSVGSCPLEPGGGGGVQSGGRGLLGCSLALAGTYKVLEFSKALEYSPLGLVAQGSWV